MINRISKKRLLELIKTNPATAILGPRQVGKTTLAKDILKSYLKKSVYLDLDNVNDLRKLDDSIAFLDLHKNELVIIDEVQVLPHLFRDLRPSIDNNRKSGRFLLLGSASPALIKGVSQSLTGRISFLELTPFNLTEVALKELSKQYSLWLRGGFPLSFLANSDSASMNWRNSFVKSYVQSELESIFHTEFTSVIIQNFWQMLAHNNGELWNAEKISSSLGISSFTVKRYLDYMEGAFLVRRLYPWFVNIKKRLVKSPKVYIRDSGILHSLLNINSLDDLYGHPSAGFSWEGFVIEQTAMLMPETHRIFFYRTHHGAEADLIIIKGIKPVAAIEIKFSNAPVISRGFYECINDLKTKFNFIITPGSDNYLGKNKIQICSLNYFLRFHIQEILKIK